MKLSPKAIFGGITVYFGMAVGTYLYLRSTKPPPTCECQHEPTQEQEEVFDRIADIYDQKIGFDETVMGVKLLRWWLMRKVEGDVLEVSAGTGRNLPYYDLGRLKSLTLTDTSRQMLLNAWDKYDALRQRAGASGGGGGEAGEGVVVRFALGDGHRLVRPAGSGSSGGGSSSKAAEGTPAGGEAGAAAAEAAVGGEEETRFGPALRTPQTFEPGSFDCVVDTFGLCSHDDPVQVLKEMARACKPGGKIVLLEHGRSSWGFINRILDNGARAHKDKWGCFWNRDILELVRQAGLKVDSVSRWHFGTTYVILAEPAPSGVQAWRRRA